MKIWGRLRTVFFKLLMSYVVLIMLTLAVGVTSYFFFASSFNQQVEKVNHRILTHLGQIIEDDIVGMVEKTYLSIITEDKMNSSQALFFFDNPVSGNHKKISDIHQQLITTAAANSGVIDSISIYYKANNIVLSSGSGLTYLDEPSSINVDWLQTASATPTTVWMETRKVKPNMYSDSNMTDVLTFVRPYPNTPNAEKIKGYIAIQVKERALYDIISSQDPNDTGRMLLLALNGKTLSRSDHEQLYEKEGVKPYAAGILKAREASNGFIEEIGGVKSMVSYITLPSLQWKLISVTSVSDFYKNTVPIRNTLVLICIIAIVVGLLISNLFTRTMYRPLRTIMQTTRQLFGVSPLQHENEYKLIDRVITNLSVKVSELEKTLTVNMPLIKHNLVLGLLKHKIHTSEELAARLQMLNIEWSDQAYHVVTFRMNDVQMRSLPLEKSQFVKYNVIDYIEQMSDARRQLLAIELSEQDIHAVIATQEHDLKADLALVEDIVAYIDSSFGIETAASVGFMVESPLELHQSFREAQAILKLAYFLPDQGPLYGTKLLHRDLSREEIPEEWIERFAASLRSQKREGIAEIVAQVVQLMRTGNYSAEHCHQRCQDLAASYRSYLKDMLIRSEDVLRVELVEQFDRIRNVQQFELWLLAAIGSAMDYLEDRNNNRVNDMIQRVKSFVQSNIDSPLSLDMLAEQVSLSPRYLSRVFKDEVGMNFTDYVTIQRILRARELILTTDWTVEQIAEKVGFNSSAYFIKRFREYYGITPKNYKLHYASNEERNDSPLETTKPNRI